MFKLLIVVACVASASSPVSGDEENEHLPKLVDNPLARLNEELVGPDRTYDNQAWRAIETPTSPDVTSPDEPWRPEEVRPEPPPRRRRPGRKRKRRPHTPPPEVIEDEQQQQQSDGVRFNIESGIRVEGFEAPEGRPVRQKRPTRIHEDQQQQQQQQHWRGEAVNEDRPLRKRGHRRRQRPYLPNLNIEPTAYNSPPNLRSEPNVRIENNEEAEIRAVEEGFKISDINEQVPEETRPEKPVELTTITFGQEEAREEPVQGDKSYRRPYSLAKKQETEESAGIGGSSDLKALLKQSGGLSLSEVLQQRNLSLADLLTGKQYALSALKPSNTPDAQQGFTPISVTSEEVRIEKHPERHNHREDVDTNETDKQRRRLPPVSRDNQQLSQRRVKPIQNEEKPAERADSTRRRLPPTSTYRRQKPKAVTSENVIEPKETTTEKIAFTPSYPKKTISDNLIKTKNELEDVDIIELTTETPINTKNLVEDEPEVVITTTQETITTTIKKDARNRLSLKPRLRLPAVKATPKRISNPIIKQKDENKIISKNNTIQEQTQKRAPIPSQAIPINLKDMFGMSDIISVAKTMAKNKDQNEHTSTTTATNIPTINNYRSYRRTTTEATTTTSTTRTTSTTTTTQKPIITKPKISAKDEILEVLTDLKGGERLTKILAERNMTLKELVEHRERGSSQVHLADIFHNASREPDPAEPFLAKSLIEPISKEIYPLKALLEGNMREPTISQKPGITTIHPDPPPMHIDFAKASQNEESLGIVTLFDKFSDFIAPKDIDPKDIKKDSDGSSYYTSVINVKPTDEIYRESRSEAGFHNSHKQMSEIYSSIPTYIKTEEVIDAKVVQDWNVPHQNKNTYNQNNPILINGINEDQSTSYKDKDIDGDGLVVLDDIERIEQIDNHIAQASNQHIEENYINPNNQESNFYSKLPVGVRSAIIVSSAIVGTSLIVFLAIFVACRWRQKRRNLLKYEDSFNAAMGRSPMFNGSRKLSKNNCSSRSISPILITGETMYRNQKINTMDSQMQQDAQDYLWDSLRKPFQ